MVLVLSFELDNQARLKKDSKRFQVLACFAPAVMSWFWLEVIIFDYMICSGDMSLSSIHLSIREHGVFINSLTTVVAHKYLGTERRYTEEV